jgi:hypothetical protein
MKLMLAAGDLACFLLFALIGLRNHDEGLTVAHLIRAAGLFWLAWAGLAQALGLYGEETLLSRRRLLGTWAAAWVVGLTGRTILFDRSPEPAFAIVALLFNGVALLLWRTLASFLTRAAGRARTGAGSSG